MKPTFVRTLCLSITVAVVALAQPAPAGGTAPPAPVDTNVPPPLAADPLATSPVYLPETNRLALPEAKVEPKKPVAPKLPGIGLRGTVKAVDAKAVTFTVGGKTGDRVIHITSASRYLRNGKPATISDLAADDSFSGRVKKNKREEEVLITGEFKPGKVSPSK